MPKRSRKTKDFNQIARSIVDQVTRAPMPKKTAKPKDPSAVSIASAG